MKKLISFVLVICMIATMITAVPITANAAYTEGIYKYTVSDGKATITRCDTYASGSINIPATIGGYPVTSIGDDAFWLCTTITEIIIPNSVRYIGEHAFSNCHSLIEITIPNSVTSIEYAAFAGCYKLKNLTIPNSVTSIGEGVFSNCESLTSITIPNSVTCIEKNVFNGCSGLIEITIPNSVTSIGNSSFSGCDSLTSITIPNSVTSIGECAFLSCDSLTSITIPDSVTSIGQAAFQKCGSLTEITIPNSVKRIGYATFYECSSLTDITIPNSVKSIEDRTFSYCYNLASVTIGDSVTTIGEQAFFSCYRLTGVSIPNSVTSIGEGVFSNCESLTSITIPNSVTCIEKNVFNGCSGLIEITIPNSVTSIGNSSFSGCDSLTSITIPDSVTSIGNSSFSGCESLTSITIPNGVKSIGDYAFRGCDSLTSITIPNSVTSIGNKAFYYCESLTSITILSGVTSIGEGAFSKCESLTSIIIPSSVTSIGNGAFEYCYSLIDVYYSGTEEEWSQIRIDSDNDYLKNATIHYNYGKTVNKNTDTNNENNSTITDKKIVHSIPSDINDEIVINRKGSAYGYVVLHDKNGNAYANKSVKYTVTDSDGNYSTALSTTDVNGSVGITTAEFENTGADVVTKTITATFENDDIKDKTFIFNVKVAPISYKQSWSGKITAGGKVSAKQSIFSVGAAGEYAKDIALEEVYKNGKRDLHLTSAMDREAAVNAKVGLYAGKNFINNDKVDLGGANGKIAFDHKVGYGLYIENYDQNNVNQRRNIEAFLADSILAVSESNVLPRLLFDYYLEKRGITVNNEKTLDLSFSTSAGFNAPEIKFGNFTAGIGGISGNGEWTWGKSVDKDNVVTTTTSTECTADRKLFEIEYKKSFKDDGSIGTGTSINSERFINNLVELSGGESGGEIKSIEFKSAEDYKISSKLLKDSATEYFKSIIYEDDAARAIASKSSFIKGIAEGGFKLFGIGNSREVYELMSVSEHKAKYERTKKHTDTYGKDFDIGISDELGISFGISGSHTYSYKSQTGVLKDGFVYRNTSSDLDSTIKNSANTLDKLINPIIDGIKADLKEAVAHVKGSLKEGVEWLGAKLKGAAEWTVSIVSFDKNTVSLHSYAVLTTTEDNTDISASSVSTTIGMPYIVSVQDADGKDVVDFKGKPIELTLSYDSDALLETGLWNSPELLDSMRIFCWDEANRVYVCVGGVLDFDNSSVTCNITKPGQYILAIDNCPPAVTAIEVSGQPSTPQITAVVADLSGVSELTVAIDGDVVVDKDNFAQYYDVKESRFTYDVSEPLSAGEHTVTINCCDSLGNTTKEPYTLVFDVDDNPPVISEVSVPEFSENNEIQITAKVDDDNISAVYAEIKYGDNVYSEEMEYADGVRTATISDLPKFAQLGVTIKAVDSAGNVSESEQYISTIAYSEKDSFYPGILDFDGKNVKILVNNKSDEQKEAYLIVNAYDSEGELAETVSQQIMQGKEYAIYDIELDTPCTRVRAELATQPDATEYLATGFTAYSDIADLYCKIDTTGDKLIITSYIECKDTKVIVCSYNDNELEDIILRPVELKTGDNIIDISGLGYNKGVRVFVWDSKLKPVAEDCEVVVK